MTWQTIAIDRGETDTWDCSLCVCRTSWCCIDATHENIYSLIFNYPTSPFIQLPSRSYLYLVSYLLLFCAVEHGQHIIKLDDNGEFKSHLLPISMPSAEAPITPRATAMPSPAASETSSSIQTADGDGHLICIRKDSTQTSFEDVPLRVSLKSHSDMPAIYLPF